MDCDAIRDSPIGELAPVSGVDPRTGEPYAHFAYIPHPLPSSIDLEPGTWKAVATAEAALARLDQASQQVPEPALLRRPALRREAQSTNALEGTFAPFEEVLEPEVEDRELFPAELRANLNYVVAAEMGFEWVAQKALTSGFVGQLQRTVVQGTPDAHADAGKVREQQVVVGPRDAPIVESRFVPPPPGMPLRSSFDQLIDWIRDPPEDFPILVRAALAHYQFETLHPFSDGNGRIGRLLIVLQLMRAGALREPILVVSPWFENRRADYQDELLGLSRTGNWDAWVHFFTTGVTAAADATRERVETLLQWRKGAMDTAQEAKLVGVAERVTSELIGNPVLTASRVATAHGVSHQAAMNALRRLAEIGLLAERDRNGRKTFVAPRVIQLLSA